MSRIRKMRSCALICEAFLLFMTLVSLGQLSAQDRVFVGNNRLLLGTEQNLSASVRAGDLDGDGDMDLVVANGRHWPQQNYVFINDGRAHFNLMRPLGSDRSTSYACEVADLDGDGDLDIVTGNAMAPCNIFLNDSAANFTKSDELGAISSVRSVTLADVDGDRATDVIVSSRGRPNSIHFNDGAGGFADVQPFGESDDSTLDVAAADVNGDGRQDLLLANRDAQLNLLLLGSADRSFQKSAIGLIARNSRALVVADLNGDGNLDCAVGNIGERNTIYLGDGRGGFGEEIEFGTSVAQTYALAARDMDNDGDIDLVAGHVGSQNAVYFNVGDGRDFRELFFGDASTATYGICVADLDGDDFLDIAVANSGSENRLFLNRPAAAREQAKSSNVERPKTPDSPLLTGQVTPRSDSTDGDTDWPAFRGRGARGVSTGFTLPLEWNAENEQTASENIRWRQTIPGLGHSSPVVSGDRILLATSVATQGEAPLLVGRGGAPDAADDNGVQKWQILCLNKWTGEVIWERTCREGKPRATRHAKATHANTTITVQGNRVIAFFGSEGLYCYDLEGELLWEKELGVINISKYGIGWGYASSPAVHDGRIVLVCDDPEGPFLVALSLETGDELWRVARNDDSERNWSTPFIYEDPSDGVVQVVVNGWPCVVSYQLVDGTELWRIRGGGDNPVPTPFAVDGRIYITSAHGDHAPIHVVHPTARGDLTDLRDSAPNDAFLWSVDRGGAYMSTPVVCGDYLYLGNSNGIVRCFHARTGEKMYEERLGSGAGVIASLIAGDDKVYCASENGNVYVLPSGPTFELLAVNPMGHPCFATPAISEGVIFIRTTTELIAIQD